MSGPDPHATGGPAVVHRPERGRYEVLVDGAVVGALHYRVEGDVVVMPHTVVEAEHRGRGYAEVLVERGLADAREAGRRVRADCWYVAGYLRRHPGAAEVDPPA